MEDTNFVILNIPILIRSNFPEVSQEDIALLTLQKSVLLVLSQNLERKNGRGGRISNNYEGKITNSVNK